MRPLRVAVWGLGPHALRRIVPALAAARGVELYGVCSRNADTVSACADGSRCLAWTDPAAMLDDAAVDAVYVATPTGLHASHGRQVLDAHRHLWCEKPLTTRLEDTSELLDLSRRVGRSIGEGLMYLHHPHFQQLAAHVHGGRLGRIASIESKFGIPTLDTKSFRDDPALGGGALFDVGCYPVSALLALFPGETHVVDCAEVRTRDGFAVDTDGHAIIRISNGTVAHLEWRTHCAYRNELSVWGETGSLSTELVFSKPESHVPVFHLRDMTGIATSEAGTPANHFVAMLESFAEAAANDAHAESERVAIGRRAELMDDLWKGRQ